jgi:hypothetical protein
MKVVLTDSFFKSFKENIIDASTWYKLKFWKNKWFDLRRGIRNLRAYFKVVANIYPWNVDYPVLSLTKVSLERVLKYLEHGNEVEETRLPKIKDIKRSIELIDHYLKDDYAERCGWKHEGSIFDPPTEENSKALKESHKLQEEEWDELFTLLKKMRGWWD